MRRMLYDAIVVGSGPGGATAAYFLGAAGWRVLVLEKAGPPRYKPCGGGISRQTLNRFPFAFDDVVEARVDSVVYTLGRHEQQLPLPPGALLMVMRDRFDHHILRQARAELRRATVAAVREGPDSVVVTTREGESFQARFVVGADGANSVVARSCDLLKHRLLAGAIEAEVAPRPDVLRRFGTMPLFAFGELELGYLWIFPKAEHLSIGIAALRPKPGELQRTLKRVMQRYGVELDGARLHGHTLPLYTGKQPVNTDRVLLVGDAAGLVDPLTGEGIRFAIWSGHLAAEALLSGHARRYGSMVRRHIGNSHALGLRLACLFYRHPRAAFALGVRNPFATRAFVDLLAGRGGYARLVAHLVGTLPPFLLCEAMAGLVGRSFGTRLRRLVYGTAAPAAVSGAGR